MTRHSAAIAALTLFALAVPAAHAAPARSKASLSKSKGTAAAKRKAAAAKASSEEAERREAEAAAEAARLRAQWGLLAEIGVGDFETSDGLPVTVRRSGETVEMTAWTSVARGRIAFERNPATGEFTLSAPGQWSRKTFPATVEADGTIEATMKNGARWTALSRDSTGAYVFAGAPGGKMTFGPIRPYSKAAQKIASLVASGKVSAAGSSETATAIKADRNPSAAPSAVASVAAVQPMTVDVAYAYLRNLHGFWSNNDMMWIIRAQADSVVIDNYFDDQPNGKGWTWKLSGGALLAGDVPVTMIPGGLFHPRSNWAMKFLDDGSFEIISGKLKNGVFAPSKPKSSILNDGRYARKDLAAAKSWIDYVNTRVAQRAQSSGGGGGMFGKMLGGALMGAMLGGGGQSSIDLAMAGAQAASGGGNTLDMLNAMGGVASAQAEQSKRELDATIARAEAQAEADRQRKRQEEVDENARRVAAANARQQAIADQYATQRAATDAARGEQLALAERQRVARAKADADAKAEAERQRRDTEAKAQAETRRQAEAQKLAERQRREEEARRPVAYKEGVVVCQQQGSRDYWRCDGPLQITYAAFGQSNWRTNIGQACGGSTINDLGMVSGYRAFGCGFGIHPSANMRGYPGNRDVPAALGLYIPDRGTFYCPTTTSAYCRGR